MGNRDQAGIADTTLPSHAGGEASADGLSKPASGLSLLFGSWLLWSGLALSLAWYCQGIPGPFYDECVQAGPARDFLEGDFSATHIPHMWNIPVAGGPLPWMTQPYMGALKSQLLLPILSLFGYSIEVVRATTLAWSLFGLLAVMLWLRQAYGLAVALLGGLFLATDPTYFFISRHDWGSFSLSLLCRGVGLALITAGWPARRVALLFLGGLALGLGVYNKIDFGVFLVGIAAGAVVAFGRGLWDEIRSRPLPASSLLLGLALGLCPLLPGLASTLWFSLSHAGSGHGPMAFTAKAWTYAALTDGSYFYRLMASGGAFNWKPEMDQWSFSLRGWAHLTALAIVAAAIASHSLPRRQCQGSLFALVSLAVILLGMVLMPDASRIHHTLTIYPFPQLLAALAVTNLWQNRLAGPLGLPPPLAPASRLAAVILALVFVGSSIAWTFRAVREFERTGGKVFWSDALLRFVAEHQGRSDETIVSIDWGFHEQLSFLLSGPALRDMHWPIFDEFGAGKEPTLAGGPNHVYLVHPPARQFNVLSGLLLDVVGRMPGERVSIEPYRDRSGDPAFFAIRFREPHVITLLRSGQFNIRLNPAPAAPTNSQPP